MFDVMYQIFTSWFIWLPLTLILAYLTYRNLRKTKKAETFKWVLMTIEVPKNNEQKSEAAENMFASLHGILRNADELRMTGGAQEHLSFEIASFDQKIHFYVRAPEHLAKFVKGQIEAQYENVEIRMDNVLDYTSDSARYPAIATAELATNNSYYLPIKISENLEVDTLASITSAMVKNGTQNEAMWVQILVKPIADNWQKKAGKMIDKIKAGKTIKRDFGGLIWFLEVVKALWEPPQSTANTSVELDERRKEQVSAAEQKSQKLGYEVKIRLASLSDNTETSRQEIQSLFGTFKQFNSTNLNGFRLKTATNFNRESLEVFQTRDFSTAGFILNIEELAAVFHLPHTNVKTQGIVWADVKKAEPPNNLPILTGDITHDQEISAFGMSDFHGTYQQFGIRRVDRSRHMYIIGQTGTGKSGLLELLALSDIFHHSGNPELRHGYAIIDPHGDYAVNNLRFIPPERLGDVVYFNPADTAFPLGFNPMEVSDPAMRNNISSEIISVLKKLFDNSWGPRLEYILRYTLLALLEYPDTTLLDITKMLTDKKFRDKVLTHTTDSVVRNFWQVEFASWTERYIAEAVPPILNKVGAFVANPIIRNIIGQPKSTFNIRQIMDEGKILIVNLSKGLIGEDNASVLGSFLVSKIQLAAMSRSDIARVEDRRPFYLYVDEFQNFATDSFATILSEARKYGLNLTVANQYISQMEESVRDAVFGNVGTMISMRVSAEDAPLLAKHFEPQFEASDLLDMHNRRFVISMIINGEKASPFSATTLALPTAQVSNNFEQIISRSRENYARRREDVESEIDQSIMPSAAALPKGAPNPNDPRTKVAHELGIEPKLVFKTSPSGVTGSQKLTIPGAEINVTENKKSKRRPKKQTKNE